MQRLVIFVSLFFACANTNQPVKIYFEENPQIQFAIDEIKAATNEKGIQIQKAETKNADIVLSTQPGSPDLKTEGFSIKTDDKIIVFGADAAGAIYGGLELAEQIKLYSLDGIQETTQNPYMERRVAKFNIPLDDRTPSYTDPCDAARNNIPEMWNFDFWA
ncbi:MAG: hypothetical protein L3J11_07965 [Draconibacterium sp.]|nr:hypothetical protein [Draconibacterium sp.]